MKTNFLTKEASMSNPFIPLIFMIIIPLIFFGIQGCSTDAEIASHNLSKSAEMFEVNRRVVFYNGITGEYMLSVEGLCSITKDNVDNQLELTCKVGPNDYKKHFLGLSDNVTYFVEQLEPAQPNVFRYKVIFNPSEILPDIDFKN